METFDTFMTVGELKKILADMADDAIVTARDRDCISLDQIHVVNHPTIVSPVKTGQQLIDEGQTYFKGYETQLYYQKHPEFKSRFVPKIEDVYGGRNMELDNKSKQAIIFCDCD